MIVNSGAKSARGLGKAEAPLRLLPSDHVCLIFAWVDFARSLLSESLEQRLQCSCLLLLEYRKSLNCITFTERGETNLLELVIKST